MLGITPLLGQPLSLWIKTAARGKVLTPLDEVADFLVIDREGGGVNLEEVCIEPVNVTA